MVLSGDFGLIAPRFIEPRAINPKSTSKPCYY